eukprot:1220058-Rhodomonas_salina.1
MKNGCQAASREKRVVSHSEGTSNTMQSGKPQTGAQNKTERKLTRAFAAHDKGPSARPSIMSEVSQTGLASSSRLLCPSFLLGKIRADKGLPG